jgi:hypothetical protein
MGASLAYGYQGQRSLKRCPGYYFQQEVFAPTTRATLHHDATLPQMLLQQRQREPIQPRKILTQVLVADPRFILAVRHVQTPMTTILDPPMTPHRMRKQLHAHVQVVEELWHIANRLENEERTETAPAANVEPLPAPTGVPAATTPYPKPATTPLAEGGGTQFDLHAFVKQDIEDQTNADERAAKEKTDLDRMEPLVNALDAFHAAMPWRHESKIPRLYIFPPEQLESYVREFIKLGPALKGYWGDQLAGMLTADPEHKTKQFACELYQLGIAGKEAELRLALEGLFKLSVSNQADICKEAGWLWDSFLPDSYKIKRRPVKIEPETRPAGATPAIVELQPPPTEPPAAANATKSKIPFDEANVLVREFLKGRTELPTVREINEKTGVSTGQIGKLPSYTAHKAKIEPQQERNKNRRKQKERPLTEGQLATIGINADPSEEIDLLDAAERQFLQAASNEEIANFYAMEPDQKKELLHTIAAQIDDTLTTNHETKPRS